MGPFKAGGSPLRRSRLGAAGRRRRFPSPALAALLLLALVVTGMTVTMEAPAASGEEAGHGAGLLGPSLSERSGGGGSKGTGTAGATAVVTGKAATGPTLAVGAAGSTDFWDPPAAVPAVPGGKASLVAATKLLATLKDEEVLGQVFLLGWPGTEPPRLLYDWIEKRGIAGVKVFGWNAEDSTKLAAVIAGLQSAALSSGHRVPLLVATDQEGGIVRHVKGETSETPGNMAIGASGLPSDAYWSGFFIARELDALGINMNFGPAVDLATMPRGTLIGVRAFAADPLVTGILGAAWSAGTMAAGLIPTAKHFPGHGGTTLDSHGQLPSIDIGVATLWDRELLPFRMLVGEGLPAVMSGHLAFPRLDPSGLPASLSRYFMTDILRTKLGFSGVAVTDDLRMGGVAGSFAANCRRALEAGNDLLMTSILPALDDEAWTSLLMAYRAEPRFKARVREAATRVLTLKFEWLAARGRSALVPLPEYLGARVPDPEGTAFFKAQAARSVTALDASALPWKPAGRLLVAGPLSAFAAAAAALWPGSADFRFSWRPESAALPAELAAFDQALAGADSVLVCVASDAGMDFALRARARGKSVAILSILSPLPLARASGAVAAVAVYSLSPESLAAGLAALRGEGSAPGRFPFDLGGRTATYPAGRP